MNKKYTIYHNPKCSKSREVLKILNENKIEPEIHLYLKNKLSVEKIKIIVKLLGQEIKNITRKKEKVYKELSLENANDEELLQAISNNPALLERPIVTYKNKAIIGRPPEEVLKILE